MTIRFIAFIAAVTTSTLAFAGTDGSSLTREQVRAELVQLRATGYDQSQGEDPNYPIALQAALVRLATRDMKADSPGALNGTK